ncbi:MAG: hypothetical protein QM795_07755 [Pseudoxanthomonas sp.]
MGTSWKELEAFVRSLAALRFNAPCQSEAVSGVNVDGVVHLGAHELILVEITEEFTLDKVRGDIQKIASVRMGQLLKGVSCKAFVVLPRDPTPGMAQQGSDSAVTVLSVKSFESEFFDYGSYVRLRTAQAFGSAVDSETGQNDPRKYVDVTFASKSGDKTFDVESICASLRKGEKIVAVGDYGTGKSRLVREVFKRLSEMSRDAGAYALAINLRDHWGSGNFLEILGGHLQRIGLSGSVDNAIKLLRSKGLILLLDGFDEIGAQSHDTQMVERKALRRSALKGVRDLVLASGAGILVTGRSHYFDDDQEILDALGLGASAKARFIEVPPTFNQDQARSYLQGIGLDINPPEWLPKKPLVFQIAAELDPEDLKKILAKDTGSFEFWGVFLGAVTRREAKGVQDSITPYAIRRILMELGGLSRGSKEYLGRFRPTDINEAYRLSTGTLPDAVGQQLLARMCTLGRIEPESPDRQFLDPNIAEVIRAEHLISKIASLDDSITKSKWTTGLRFIGAMHAATSVRQYDMAQHCHAMLAKFATSLNTTLLGEIVSILTIVDDDLDFKAISLKHAYLPVLYLQSGRVSNLEILSSEIMILALDLSTLARSKNISVRDSVVSLATGISTSSALPDWIRDTEVINYDQNVSNSASIKASSIPDGQKLLLSVIHKLFFQPGKGREEAALLKGGYGKKFDHGTLKDILRRMRSEGLINSFKGDDGEVYTPVRHYTERMARIRSELTLSEDPLWVWAADLH